MALATLVAQGTLDPATGLVTFTNRPDGALGLVRLTSTPNTYRPASMAALNSGPAMQLTAQQIAQVKAISSVVYGTPVGGNKVGYPSLEAALDGINEGLFDCNRAILELQADAVLNDQSTLFGHGARLYTSNGSTLRTEIGANSIYDLRLDCALQVAGGLSTYQVKRIEATLDDTAELSLYNSELLSIALSSGAATLNVYPGSTIPAVIPAGITVNDYRGGSASLPQANVATVPAAKRQQVVKDIAAAVGAGGQARIQETDLTLIEKHFTDSRVANAPYFYWCTQEVNFLTNAVEAWWNRFRIQ